MMLFDSSSTCKSEPAPRVVTEHRPRAACRCEGARVRKRPREWTTPIILATGASKWVCAAAEDSQDIGGDDDGESNGIDWGSEFAWLMLRLLGAAGLITIVTWVLYVGRRLPLLLLLSYYTKKILRTASAARCCARFS